MSGTKGRFVWYDLMTTDVKGARSFYGDIIGWKTTSFEGGGDYHMWTAGDRQVGGIMDLPEEAQKHGAPPHWLGYVAVDNVDATVQRAKSLGGSVMLPGQDIPNIGRFAVLADPQGAVFSLFQGASGQADMPDTSGPGHFSWAELNTTDWESAWRFYSELFGWKPTSSMDMGEGGQYFMFGMDEKKSMGGMSNVATMMGAPAHWLHYINVDDVDVAAKRVVEKGGKVLNGPMDIPGGDRIVQCMDPQGSAFALYSSGSK